MGGFERWHILNQIKLKSPNIPILILSTHDSIDGDARLDKADGYIIKDIYMDKVEDLPKGLRKMIEIHGSKWFENVYRPLGQ